MRKPLSPETKYKIKLFSVYIAAVVLCIFWLTAEVDITRRIKQDRLTSSNILSVAEKGISEYSDGSDPEGMEKAGERLLELYSMAKRNSESSSVLLTFRRGYPKFTAQELSDIGAVAAAMTQDQEAFIKYSDDLIKAIGLISGDIDNKAKKISPEAAEIFKKIADERSHDQYQQ